MSLRPRSMKIQALRQFTEELQADAMDESDEKVGIDFSSVGLYLAGLQVASTIVICACASVLSCWVLPPNAISAVRTLAITSGFGLLLVRRPVRVGRVRGVSTVFNALRPAVATYILALVIEQLVHTCVQVEEFEHSTLRRVMYHIMTAIMIVSAFARARHPKSESDVPFLLAGFCVLMIALLPPAALNHAGPLCEPASLVAAGERCLRALFFSAVYTVHVYAAAPGRNVTNELFICIARATAASLWVLAASAWTLPLAPLQVAVVLFSRLGDSPEGEPAAASNTPLDSAYEHIPLSNGDGSHEHHTAMGGTLSDVESGDVGNPASLYLETPKLGLGRAPISMASTRSSSAMTNGNGNGNGNGGGGGLSFHFSNTHPQPTVAAHSAAVAAAIARESRAEL